MMVRLLHRLTCTLLLLLSLAAFSALAQTSAVAPTAEAMSGGVDTPQQGLLTDTLEIRFKLDSVMINMGFDGNQQRWDNFERNFMQRFGSMNPLGVKIDIYSGASPEGTVEHNRWLGQERGESIRGLIEQRLRGRVGYIVIHNEAARWQGLYDAVAASDETWRDEVLDIIRQPAKVNENGRDHREWKLRHHKNPDVWEKMLSTYLPPLRSGGSAILSWAPELLPASRDTIVLMDTVVVMNQQPVIIYECNDCDKKKVREPKPIDRRPAWAVKTNLLMWGVVAPNVEVEIPLGKKNRWSLEVEYFHPWFVWNSNAHASEFLNLGAELRYYLGKRDKRRWLDGWHVGVAVAAGYYDWEWKKHNGFQGEYVNGYFNIGYQHRWGSHWAIDVGAGFGVIASKYRDYFGSSTYPERHLEEQDYHLMWYQSKHFVYPGATHINVSIVYMFNNWPFRFKNKRMDN